jgi:hypothetical protein
MVPAAEPARQPSRNVSQAARRTRR